MTHISDRLAADLRAALAAEAASAVRYTYFAHTAEIEGHSEVARLFGELADSLVCAAHGHLDVLRDTDSENAGRQDGVGDSRLNLASSVVAALHDAGDLYPRLTSAALEEGQADTASWLSTLTALKKGHTARLQAALDDLTRTSGEQHDAALIPGGADE
ncbi:MULTISPECIES: ferritin family protein [Streptomyces]|jgi:rubrerythrin|uniref:NucQ n=2 Tax=Streptomyces TaxID=1883 RepID=A0A142C6W0_9ACTN|nr:MULTISPECIES: ferritin family protein [Streptomyces]AMP46612.1 NucQ [Streptomyces calvus]MBA8944408.1 rubrerythrin [Streptomyces calvus]MBA8976770.1 rubrerythrin [Streptomyces calvus]MYS29783.1 rubrerythrin [Streptomyces sp. SID7804]QDI67382.1 rubrerythrin [Streptomyces calvus]